MEAIWTSFITKSTENGIFTYFNLKSFLAYAYSTDLNRHNFHTKPIHWIDNDNGHILYRFWIFPEYMDTISNLKKMYFWKLGREENDKSSIFYIKSDLGEKSSISKFCKLSTQSTQKEMQEKTFSSELF